MEPTAGFMTHVTCRLTAKNRDQLRNTTLGIRVWATFTFLEAYIWGRLKMHDLKMHDWKMTDKILANSGQNYGVWKMQDWKMPDHVN